MTTDQHDEVAEMFYTTSKVAKTFSVTTETVRDWIAAGKLPGARQINGIWRIPREAVIAFANGKHGD